MSWNINGFSHKYTSYRFTCGLSLTVPHPITCTGIYMVVTTSGVVLEVPSGDYGREKWALRNPPHCRPILEIMSLGRFLTCIQSSDTNDSLPSQNDGIPFHYRLEKIFFCSCHALLAEFLFHARSGFRAPVVWQRSSLLRPQTLSSCQQQRLWKLVTTFQQWNKYNSTWLSSLIR